MHTLESAIHAKNQASIISTITNAIMIAIYVNHVNNMTLQQQRSPYLPAPREQMRWILQASQSIKRKKKIFFHSFFYLQYKIHIYIFV